MLSFEERLTMLQALRESRDALEWRVKGTKASLIVLRSAAGAGAEEVVQATFSLGSSPVKGPGSEETHEETYGGESRGGSRGGSQPDSPRPQSASGADHWHEV